MGLRLGIVLVLVVLIDQASKYYIQETMELHTSIMLLGDVVRITYIQNPGAAFGITIGNRAVFLILSAAACAFMIYYLIRLPRPEVWSRYAIILVLAGAIGNLIDRIRFGKVTDFIDIGVGAYRWPVFNVADMAVTVGVLFLFIRFSSSRHRTAETPPPTHREFIPREDRPA